MRMAARVQSLYWGSALSRATILGQSREPKSDRGTSRRGFLLESESTICSARHWPFGGVPLASPELPSIEAAGAKSLSFKVKRSGSHG